MLPSWVVTELVGRESGVAALDRGRLAKLLGMLGSEHEGEVVTAARMATELLNRHGADWNAVLKPAPSVRIERVEVVREVTVEVIREVMVSERRSPGPVERVARRVPALARLLLKAGIYPALILRDYAGTVRECLREKMYVEVCQQAVIGGCSTAIAAVLWGGAYYGLVVNLIG